jgi:hypothetical protein
MVRVVLGNVLELAALGLFVAMVGMWSAVAAGAGLPV